MSIYVCSGGKRSGMRRYTISPSTYPWHYEEHSYIGYVYNIENAESTHLFKSPFSL